MEAAVGGGARGDGRLVRVGNRLDDGEAETEAVAVVGASGIESLEWLEDPLELARRDLRAGVGDGEDGVTVAGVGCEADAAAVDVVVDGVAEEVGDEPLDEARVAGRLRRLERGVEREAVVICGGGGGRADRGEVDGLLAVEAALAAGEREQRFDQTFLLLADGEELLAGVPVGVDAGVGIAEGELEQGALEGERGAQLVGGVGDELSLRLEGGFEPAEQSVDGGAELLELVVGSFEVEPAVEVAGGDVAGGVGDGAQRAQSAAGDDPAEPERKHRHHGERDRGVEEQLVQRRIRLPLRRGERDLRGWRRARSGRPVPRSVSACALVDADASGALEGTTACRPELMKKLPVYWWWTSDVGDCEQGGRRAEEETAVDECEAKADRHWLMR